MTYVALECVHFVLQQFSPGAAVLLQVTTEERDVSKDVHTHLWKWMAGSYDAI